MRPPSRTSSPSCLDYANGSLKRAVDGLTDEQVYHQPTEDTNNIAWLAWHMNRWKDWQGSLVSGEEQVWIRDGWCERFGIPAERTGIGDTTEQVAEFRPPLDLLWSYTEAAHTTFRAGQRPLDAGGDGALHARPRRTEAQVALHPRRRLGMKHTGQIEYLRGWRGRMQGRMVRRSRWPSSARLGPPTRGYTEAATPPSSSGSATHLIDGVKSTSAPGIRRSFAFGGNGALHARPRRTEAQVALHPGRRLGHHEAHRPDRVPAATP